MKRKHVKIKINLLELNEGQVEGLPKNPRFIRDEKFKALKESISTSPEFLDARPLLVYPYAGRYVVIAGNMRLRACRELSYNEIPCYIFPKETSVEKLREYTIKDNMAYGQIDWESIANEWEPEELKAWDFEIPDGWEDEISESETTATGESSDDVEKDEEVETMLNEATAAAAKEVLTQFDTLKGFSFITPHTAKIDFIRFAYYGEKYARYNSLAFHYNQFLTRGDNYSTYEGLERINNHEAKAERLRFVTGDDFRMIVSGSLAFAGAKMPLDFPAYLAKDLINEFSNDGKVLDPCCGWGGRLVGFLASSAKEYDGTDASPYQCAGDKHIYDTFKDVLKQEKKVSITCLPFEKRKLNEEYFDMAITSPPYFDTEKYIGGEQSRERYSNYDLWRDGFYTTMINKVYKALKKDGIFCLQIGSQRYPLLSDGKKIALETGFQILDIRDANMHNSQQKTEFEDGEVIIILKK